MENYLNPTQNNNPLIVRFYIPEKPYDTDLDGERTRKEGRPIYRERVYCEVRMPANKFNVIVCPADEKRHRDKASGEWLSYADMFPAQYQKFMAGHKEQHIGTPLSELVALTSTKRAELKAIDIHTVEQLASLESGALKRLGMEGSALKRTAQAYLDNAKGMAGNVQAAAEIEALKAQVADLMAAMKKPGSAEPLEKGEINMPPASDFDGWSDDELKTFIKSRTGSAPRGQPSHATLIASAEKILADEAAESEAA